VNRRVEVRVNAPVNDTEVTDRVVRAVETLFPDADAAVRDGRVHATARDLDHLAERLREQAIVDTARAVFLGSLREDTFDFDLKKQAALHDVVNFAVGNPDELGDIHVTVAVEQPDPETYIDHVAPASGERA
jgi:predicted RNA binding protein with dsRBD fold (UPF0201 family)